MDQKQCVEEISKRLVAEWDQGKYETILAALTAGILIEIREALEAQTALQKDALKEDGGAGEITQRRLGAVSERLDDLAHYVHDVFAGQVTAKITALESALAASLHHQHETDQLLQTLEGRIDRIGLADLGLSNVPAAGSADLATPTDSPTAG